MHPVRTIVVVMSLASLVIAHDESDAIIAERPYPVFGIACDFSKILQGTKHNSCYDCNSILKCTRLGGIVSGCRQRTPHCVDGRCGADPSEQCADEAVRKMLVDEELIAYTYI